MAAARPAAPWTRRASTFGRRASLARTGGDTVLIPGLIISILSMRGAATRIQAVLEGAPWIAHAGLVPILSIGFDMIDTGAVHAPGRLSH